MAAYGSTQSTFIEIFIEFSHLRSHFTLKQWILLCHFYLRNMLAFFFFLAITPFASPTADIAHIGCPQGVWGLGPISALSPVFCLFIYLGQLNFSFFFLMPLHHKRGKEALSVHILAFSHHSYIA